LREKKLFVSSLAKIHVIRQKRLINYFLNLKNMFNAKKIFISSPLAKKNVRRKKKIIFIH